MADAPSDEALITALVRATEWVVRFPKSDAAERATREAYAAHLALLARLREYREALGDLCDSVEATRTRDAIVLRDVARARAILRTQEPA